jgi:hypothetical protein
MSLARTLTRFVFLAAIGRQVTDTVVEGAIFEETRDRIGRLHPKVDQFVRCHLCVGTWVGALLAAIYRPNLLADGDGKRPGMPRQLANVAGDAVLITLGARVWNEALGWLHREVQVKHKTIDAADGSEADGGGPPAFPGISIRPQRAEGRGIPQISI